MIQAVTFWSPKGHQQPLKGSHVHHPKKSHYSRIARWTTKFRQENLPLSQSEHFSFNLIAELLAQWHHNTILFHRPTCREAGKPRKNRHWSTEEVDMWELSMNLAASTPAWKTPGAIWSCELYMFWKFKIRFGGKGIVQETWPESLKKKSSMHQEGGIHFHLRIPKDSRNPKLFSLFFGFTIRTFQQKIQPNKCVGLEHRKKKVAFWAFQLLGQKFCPPCWAPMTLDTKKKRESLLVQRRIFSPFWGLLLQEHCHQL